MSKGKPPPHAWKPGQSGNPGGRAAVNKTVQEWARQHTEEAIRALVEALQSPSLKVQAATALLDRGYGRPIQTTNMRVVRNWDDLTDEEVASLAALADQEDAKDGTRH